MSQINKAKFMSKFQIVLSSLFIAILFGCSSDPIVLEWNFENIDEINYSYSQYSKATQTLEDREKVNEFLISSDLALVVQENGNADLELRNIVSKMWIPGFEDTVTNTAENQPLARGLQSNGKAMNPSDQGSDIFEFFFVLPDSLLEEGQTTGRTIKFPYNTTSGVFFVEGVQQISFKEYKKIDNRNIAVLESSIFANHLEIPESMAREHECIVTGKTTFHFDTKNRYFTSGNIDLNVHVTTHNFLPEGKSTSKIDSQVHYEVKLKEVLKKN